MSIFKIAFCIGLVIPTAATQTLVSKTSDELHGSVRRVVIESSLLSNVDKPTEGRRRTVMVDSYDENHRISEREVYDDYGFPVGREQYRYGVTGLLLEVLFNAVDKKMSERRVYQYDSKGGATSIQTFDSTGALKLQQDFNNDRDRNILIETIRTSRGQIGKTISNFDPSGAITEVSFYGPDDSLNEKRRYKYGTDGRVAEEGVYDREGSLKKTYFNSYEVDGRGNWTKKTTKIKLSSPMEPHYEPTFMTYRTIEYFR